ncbi:TPM domain-containing protein [Sphingomonas sp.]|uniref:TPM domain-containing protein n=1 Tax=Sphingomonas sp. TaxID=28214 RepID=UPI003D6C75E6
MVRAKLTEADHAMVTAAVARAEAGTDGEIVTIVANQSDSYHDVALHYALAGMLLVIALVGLNPGGVEERLGWFSNGWERQPNPANLVFAILIVETVTFLVIRYALAWTPLRLALTPKATRARRVRRRAVQYFKVGAERRTQARVGIMLFLSLDEHIAEIVADEAIHKVVPPERWGDAMAALVDKVRVGQPGEGMAAAVAAIGAIVAEHFPKTEGDRNELPDRLIEL